MYMCREEKLQLGKCASSLNKRVIHMFEMNSAFMRGRFQMDASVQTESRARKPLGQPNI